MNKNLLKIFISITIVSCSNQKSTNWNSSEIITIGSTKDTSYIWCSIAPKKEDYSYRIGKWKFLTTDSVKIAEGEYESYGNLIWDKGGCPYGYIENSVNIDNWEFWDLNGNKTEPTRKLLKLIEFKVKVEDYSY